MSEPAKDAEKPRMNTTLQRSVGPTTIRFETSKPVTGEMLVEINRRFAEIETVLDGNPMANTLPAACAC